MTKNQIKAMMLSAAVTGLLGAAPMALASTASSATTVAPAQAMLGAFAKTTKATMGKHACKG